MEIIQVLSFCAHVLIVIIGALLLFTLWKSARIMGEMNQRMNDAQTQFKELRKEVKDFTQDLNLFFAGGRELTEDILKHKRAAEKAQAQDQS